MDIQLALHSSPRFSTWIWIPDWRVLIDVGDGASQQLGYKIRKIDTICLTHSHRDHIGGLLQAINQRGEAGGFSLVHPVGGNSWAMLENFSLKFNPGASRNAVWRALEEGDWIETGIEGRLIKSFRTSHYAGNGPSQTPRSLGYHLFWRKNKLRPEFQALSQAQITELARAQGSAAITSPVDEKIVTIGGDGSPLSPDDVKGSQLLLHEATFLSPEDYDAEEAGEDIGHVHSTVAQALEVAKESAVESVVLYHISTRYTDGEIRDAIKTEATRLGLKSQVWAALPRRIYWDLLRDKPLWSG